MNHEIREVPTTACRFAGGPFRFEVDDAGTATAPVRMVARSSQPIESHWYWGRIVHDTSGVRRHKDTLPIDYCHEEECGFLDTFELDGEQNLVVSGKLVPTSSPDDIARKIIERAKAGVPYEASIDWTGDGTVIEEIPEGFSVEVNGYEFEGPGVVVREWPLRGVAVCPYGADMNTQTSFAQGKAESLRCKFIKANTNTESGEVMAKTDKSENTELEATAVAEEPVVAEAVEEVEATEANEVESSQAAETEEAVAELSSDRQLAQQFRTEFGDAGLAYFADGLTIDEARIKEIARLRKENEQLRKKLASHTDGELTPVGFDAADDQKSKRSGFASKIRIVGR